MSFLRIVSRFAFHLAVLIGVLVAGTGDARAQAAADEPRLRGGVGGAVGPAILFERGRSAGAVLSGDVGLQANDVFAVYAAGGMGLFAVPVSSRGEYVSGGLFLDAALMLELTIADRISIAAGPAAAVGTPISNESTPSPGQDPDDIPEEEGGELFGGRIRIVGYPIVREEPSSPRRRSVSVGADVRILRGDGFGERGRSSTVLIPMITAGYSWM
jgi:hypothetical protein